MPAYQVRILKDSAIANDGPDLAKAIIIYADTELEAKSLARANPEFATGRLEVRPI